eukprot:678684-Amphidinium_carterae.2
MREINRLGITRRQVLAFYLNHDVLRWLLPLNTDGLLPQSLPEHPAGNGHNPHIIGYPYYYNRVGRRPNLKRGQSPTSAEGEVSGQGPGY